MGDIHVDLSRGQGCYKTVGTGLLRHRLNNTQEGTGNGRIITEANSTYLTYLRSILSKSIR